MNALSRIMEKKALFSLVSIWSQRDHTTIVAIIWKPGFWGEPDVNMSSWTGTVFLLRLYGFHVKTTQHTWVDSSSGFMLSIQVCLEFFSFPRAERLTRTVYCLFYYKYTRCIIFYCSQLWLNVSINSFLSSILNSPSLDSTKRVCFYSK